MLSIKNTNNQRLLFFLTLIFFVGDLFAQDRVITGKVSSSETASTLTGVSIVIQGTENGAVTDINGDYELSISSDTDTLVFLFLGFKSQKIPIGLRSIINIEMDVDPLKLNEVVVTTFGLERDEEALGYALQQIKGDALIRSGAINAVDALVGKATGIQVVRSSGSVGAGSRVLIRGTSSMVGDNQPLIVVDGIRINNESLNSGVKTRGTAQSNRLMDLNTEDIALISILKGAASTVLYGSAGATGVILITTKKGTNNEKLDINFSSKIAVDNITNTINLQNKYAQGTKGIYADPSTGTQTSWGPKITDLEYSKNESHLNAPKSKAFVDGSYIYDKNGFLVPKGTGNGKSANLYENVGSFFRTAVSYTNALSIANSGKKAMFRFSTSNHSANGIIPNEEYTRSTFKLASKFKPIKYLTFTASVNYTKSDYVRIQQGANLSGLLLGMLRTPISFDNTNGLGREAINNPSAYSFSDGSQRNFLGGGGYDSPYWVINNGLRNEAVDRLFGNIKTVYKINKWIQLSFNIGTDMTNDKRKQHFEVNSNTAASGQITNDVFYTRQTDAYLNFSGSAQLNENFGIHYLGGINLFAYNRYNLQSLGENLGFPGFIHISNASNIIGKENNEKYRTMGAFVQSEIFWKNILFLTVAVRNDFDSRLGLTNDEFDLSKISFIYPSASLSFVFTELLNTKSLLNFGKFRTSFAKVGAGPPLPYTTQSVFEKPSIGDNWAVGIEFPIAGVNGYDQSHVLANSTLTPELTTSIETGLDLRFLKGRLGVDIAYYLRHTKDAILNASLPASTGYKNIWINSGEMTSQGLEITLNTILIKVNNFEWSTQLNFTKSKSIVNKLAPGIDKVKLSGFSAATYLITGNEYGVILGGAYKREATGGPDDDLIHIPKGAIIINNDPKSKEYGYEKSDDTQRVIGNPNPNFIIGWNNTLSYKKINLTFLLDWKQGGDLWNGTAWALANLGRLALTEKTREEIPFIIDGVFIDGSPNTIPIKRDEAYWTSSVGGFGTVVEQFVQDAGWVRLREVSLSYTLPNNIFGQKIIKRVLLSITGRNLWFTTKYDGVDPETSLIGTGNGQGIDYFNMPSSKSLIFTLSLNF